MSGEQVVPGRVRLVHWCQRFAKYIDHKLYDLNDFALTPMATALRPIGMRSVILLIILVCLSTVDLLSQYPENMYTRKGTFFGGPSNSGNFTAMAVDSQGYVYGVANGNDFPTTAGAYKTYCSGPSDVAIFKFSPDLRTLVWCTYLGGNAGNGQGGYNDIGTDIAVTTQGEVVVTGWTCSNDFPVTSGANYCTEIGTTGGIDSVGVFVVKFNASGSSMIFSRLVGYTSDPTYTKPRISLTPSGEIFLVATINKYSSTPMPPWDVTANAYQSTYSGDFEMTITKLSSSGSTMYGSYLGYITNIDMIESVCYAKGKVYMTGKTNARSSANTSNFPLLSPGQEGNILILADDLGSNLSLRVCKQLTTIPDQPGGFGSAYDYRSDEINVVSYPAKLYVLDSGASQILLMKALSSLSYPNIVIANGRRKYLTNGNALMVFDSTANTMLYQGTITGATTSSGCKAVVRGTVPCDFAVLVGVNTNSTTFKTTPDVYQPTKLTTGIQPGITMFQRVQQDSFRMKALPLCGSYLFRDSTYPCTPLSIKWTFGDGSPSVIAGDTISHIFSKNGTYTVSMRIAYAERDTVYRDSIITVTTNPIVKTLPQTIYRCFNDTAATMISASGALRYEWHPGATLSDSMSATPRARPTKNMKYYVRGYDANGCYSDDSIQVYVSVVQATVSTKDTVICDGASVVLKAAGAAEFKWFPANGLSSTKTASVTASPHNTTHYSVVASEAGCADTARILVRVAHPPKLILNPPAIVCTGGSVALSVSATSSDALDTTRMSYSWTPTTGLSNATTATPLASPLKTTRYYCRATNAYGCVSIDSVEVKVQNSLELQLNSDTLTCVGSSLRLEARGGAQYSWSPRDGLDDSTKANPLCTPTKKTRYTVMTWSGDFATASCRDTAEVLVDVYAFPSISAGADQRVCKNTPVVLHARIDSSGGVTKNVKLRWCSRDGQDLGSFDSLSVMPDSSTYYILSLSNNQGCESRDTVSVEIASHLAVQAAAQTAVLPGSTVLLSVVNVLSDAHYTWYDASHSVIGSRDTLSVVVSASGWYYVHAERFGCEGVDSVFIEVKSVIDVQACQDLALCPADTTILYVLNPQAQTVYRWTSANGSESVEGDTVLIQAVQSQYYYVEATQGTETSMDSVFVQVYSAPKIQVNDVLVCEGSTAQLTLIDSSSSNHYEWRDALQNIVSTSSSYSTAIVGDYTVTAISEHGCRTQAVAKVRSIAPTQLSFRIVVPDSVQPGTMASLRVMARAATDIPQLQLQGQLRCPRSVLWSAELSADGDESYFSIDTILHLTAVEHEVAKWDAQILVTQVETIALSLRSLRTNLDSSCQILRSDPSVLRVTHACANSLFALEYVDHAINIVPNPSSGDVEIRCVDEIRVFSSLGVEVPVFCTPTSGSDVSKSYHARGLASGVYVVKSINGASSFAQTFVVYK